MRGYVDAAAAAIGCDASYVALPLLAGLASAIGTSRRARLKRGWTEPCVIWSVVIGESGTLKSPAAEAPLRPILARQAAAMERYQHSLREYDQAMLHHDAAVTEWRRHGRRSGAEPPARPEAPVCPRYWCSDVTTEALAVRLQSAPRGLLLYRDELAGWLRSYDCYRAGRGGDVAHWLTIHGARDLLVDRKTGAPATIHVPRACVSITGGIQPEVLRQVLAREHYDDGLAARLLLAMPPARAKRWSEYDMEPEQLSALAELYAGLYALDMPMHPDTGQPEPVDVPLSGAARELWVAYYDAHARELAGLTGDLAAAWAKLEGYAARLALVLHCCRVVMGQAAPGALDADSMAGGITLAHWHAHETRRVYAALAETAEQRQERELVELIRRHGGSITVRQLMRSSRQYRGSADEAEAALDALVRGGRAIREPIGTTPHGGQPTVVYRLVTGGDADTTPANTANNGVVSPSPPVTI